MQLAGLKVALFYRSPEVHGGFHTNINVIVIVQPLPGPLALAQYTALSRKQLNALVTNIHGQSGRDIQLGGLRGHELRYSGTRGQFHLSCESAYVLRGGRAYLVTGTALETRAAELERQMNGAEQRFRFTR